MQWDPALRERQTTTDRLALALRAAIYDGQFADEEELNQVELARFFKVSRVPIREALRQLQAEGLVRIVAHHRTVVVGLTLDQILELIEMRAVLEAHLVRKCAPTLAAGQIKRIKAMCEEAGQLRDYGSRWVLKNWEFHRALYGDGGSHAMIEAVERIHLKVERYARQAGSRARLSQATEEHRRIVEAIARGEFARAASLMEQHILNTGADIKRARQAPPPTRGRAVSRSEQPAPR